MEAAFAALEGSALGGWVRDSSPWTYGLVNTAHVLGAALLLGAVAVLDLRLLGLWRAVPVGALAGPTTRVAGAGLGLALASGVPLLAAQATEYLPNPIFWAKLAAVGLGGLNLLLVHLSPAWRAVGPEARIAPRLALAGGLSLTSWLTAVSAGRMIAYW